MSHIIQQYQSNDSQVMLDVLIENETIWLNQAQMVSLFQRSISVISRHIQNIFREGELSKESNLHFLQIAKSDKPVAFYSLDVIISVGYRVKSKRGTEFRIWASQVLKEYLYRGYAIYQRMNNVEKQVSSLTDQVQTLIQTALPPKQGIFYDGQIFDAYTFVADLIRSARKRIILIDNYVDDTVLKVLTKRVDGVHATMVTRKISEALSVDIERHNRQYPPVEVRTSDRYHDRFLIIDETVYHLGASLKDLGKKLFAFSRMEVKAEEIVTFQ
jgi:hypothetical protein